jgi:thiol-disulfide isomerase/thioredoxin
LKTKTYLSAAFARKPKESRDAYFEEFTRLARPIQDSLLRDFVNTKYLQLEVYRDLYMSTDWAGATNNAAVPQEMKDWKAATRLALQIKAASDKSALADFKPEVAAIATPRYRSALQDLLTHKMKFGIGDVAADFSAVDDRGNTVKLSSLKGRVIYVDVWATWCGPCMAEMPKLELLKQRYAGNESLAIVSLSIDNKKDAWLKNLADRKPGGRQWLIDRASMPDYEIEAIPRCILIDKDFKVVDLNAPRPSHNAITNLLDRLLAK